MTRPAEKAAQTPDRINGVSGWVVGLSLILLIVPLLFFSSSSWIAWPRLAGTVLSLWIARKVFPEGLPRILKVMAAIIAAILLSSWVGGWLNGELLEMESFLLLEGLSAIFGFTILLAAVLKSPDWSRTVIKSLTAIVLMLLACSLPVYFIPHEKLIPAESLRYFDATRLLLIWPTRLMMSWAHQLGYEHTNHAGLIFGVAFILAMDRLASGNLQRRRVWWAASVGLGMALFLTGSRSSLLMLAPCVPLILFHRGWKRWGICAVLIIASLALGAGALRVKEALIIRNAPVSSTSEIVKPQVDHHFKGLVKRGSSGRMAAYKTLREELSGSAWTGRGLSQNHRPLAHLKSEHSSYLATLRGGGIIALSGHLMLVCISGFAAIRLYSGGVRWPILLFAAVTTNLLFDRGSVFLINASYEFIFHWAALMLPPLLYASSRRADGLRS